MVDVTFDCRLDAKGKDPDSHSPTLRRAHQFMWSKPLPSGERFDLDISGRKPFLVHRSYLGEFRLSSDAITHRYANRPALAALIEQLDGEELRFIEMNAWPVSQCILFPANMAGGRPTINAARGINQRIGDRFDLTLECIRRHYQGEGSPLGETLQRYAPFFNLFESFAGYVEFFLLQDLLDDEGNVRFYLPFDNFTSSPYPVGLEAYRRYLRGVVAFANARAERMRARCFSVQSD